MPQYATMGRIRVRKKSGMKERSGLIGERVYDGNGGRSDMVDALPAIAVMFTIAGGGDCIVNA